MMLIFVGAGFSKAVGSIPAMTGLERGFKDFLEGKNRYDLARDYNTIKNQIEKAYKEFKLDKPDIEAILTVLENLKSEDPLCNIRNPTALYILGMSPNLIESARSSIKKEKISEITQYLKEYLINQCLKGQIKNSNLILYLFDINRVLKEWLLRESNEILKEVSENTPSLEIFTTNYDLILENFCRKNRIRYANGETTEDGRHIVDLSEENKTLDPAQRCIKIFKLHGSANWYTIKGEDDIFYHDLVEPINRTRIGKKDKEVMIYPVTEKVWMKLPFSYSYLRFQKSLICSEEWVFVGFSFKDREIVDIIINAAEIRIKNSDPLKIWIIDPNTKEIKDRINSLKDNVEPIDKCWQDFIKDLQSTRPGVIFK